MACIRRWTSWQDSFLWAVCALVTLFFASTAVAAPQGVSFQPDYAFEDQMTAFKAEGYDCLPAPYSILTHSFLERLISKAYDTCLTENTSPDQVKKYAALAAGSLSPAGVYVLPYTVAELKSDAVKCVLKAYVGASNGPTDAEKQDYLGMIDDGFKVKDWKGFVGGIPELAVSGSKDIAEAFVDSAFSGTERIQDAGLFSRAYGAIAGISTRDLKELWWKASLVELDEYESYVGQCRYAVAERSLERAAELALNECRVLGHAFRVAEQELVSDIYRNYRAVQNDLIGDSPATVIIQNTQLALKDDIEDAKQALLTHMPLLKEIDGKKKELELLTWQFAQDRKTYAAKFDQTRGALDTPHACYALDSLDQDIDRILSTKQDQQSCRSFLYRAGPDGQSLQPDTLVFELTAAGHARSGEWWAEFSRIRGVLNACDTSTALADRDALRVDIRSRPILRVIDGTCTEMPQTALEAELDGLVEPVHCQMVSVPKTLIGLPLSEAAQHLEDAFLYQSGLVKVEPQEGDIPGTILDTKPIPGSKVRKWTGVALTVYGEMPQQDPPEEMVTVPRVVGIVQTKAVGALTGAGLTSAFAEDVPADQETMTPGFIYASSHTQGATLPRGSVVTLTRIGPRPKVKVPSIAGAKTLEEAQAILSAARLVPGGRQDGDIAPDGKSPGEFYASDPPADSEVEMFSTVSPISYANLMKVPPVLGKPPRTAIDMIDASAFFKLGGVSPGEPVEGDEVPGVIQSVVPAVGTPWPEGTVVTMKVSMKRAEQPEPVADEVLAEPQSEPPETDVPPLPPEDEPPEVLPEEDAPPEVITGDDEPPPPTASDETPPEDVDDPSWIGRWMVHGVNDDGSGESKLIGRLDISPMNGDLQVQWMPFKDGKFKKFMDLPMRVDANNVLRLSPKYLEEIKKQEPSDGGSSSGVMGEVVTGTVNVLVQVISTISISRNGEDCTVQAKDPKKGPVSIEVKCIRQ